MNKEKLLKLVDELENDYDTFFTMNSYSWEEGKNTHAKHFKELSSLDGDRVQNALHWIHDCYDCDYNSELEEDNAFNYLRSVINNE